MENIAVFFFVVKINNGIAILIVQVRSTSVSVTALSVIYYITMLLCVV